MNREIKVALVGRPNVGKSALFNRIAGKKISIVDEQEGITRDRLYAAADHFGKPFQVIDTGGIHPQSQDAFQEEIRRQAEIAVEEADVLIMVVDFLSGVTALDEMVAHLLLRTQKPVVLAVNKVDDRARLDRLFPFYSLGISQIVGVSATQNFQIAELLEEGLKTVVFPPVDPSLGMESMIKVAVVGRPNVGKSTFVNGVLKEQRCVVSPIAGTTRDSVDIPLESEGIVLIDTAGIRRKAKEREVVDKFAAIRTARAIERADICLLMVDAERGMTVQEKQIAQRIEEAGKGCILLFNKWDLVKGVRKEHCLKSFEIDTPFLAHCPMVFISSLKDRNLEKCFSLVKEVHEQQSRRVSTGQLNHFVEKAVERVHPPMIKGKRLRIFYLAQVDVHPPRFVLFVNHPQLMSETYKKYLIHQFRKEYRFSGAPLQFFLKGRSPQKAKTGLTL